MDPSSAQLCRLCLETSGDVVNIWKTFQDSTIASILAKYFWFQVDENDGFPHWLCQICWIQTKTFHDFYKRIEFRHCRSNDLVSADSIKQERSVSPTKEALEPDLNSHEYERIEPQLEIAPHFLLCKEENSSEYKDYNVEEIEISQPSENTDLTLNKILKIDNVGHTNFKQKRTLPPNDERISYKTYSRTEKEKQNAQIRELFTMRCEICSDVVFETLLKAQQHYRRVHNVQGYLMCCGKKFGRRHLMLNHVRYHEQSQTERENQNAQIRELFTMRCEICSNVEFDTLLEVRRHYHRVHKVKGYLTCCGKKFWQRNVILDHVRYHTNPDAYSCDYCGKGFHNKPALKNHIYRHIPLDTRAHKCTLCSSSFTKPSLLKVHVNLTHSSKTGEKFPCDKCDKNFRSKLLLTTHIRCVHDFSLEHVCETCARRFKTKQILQNHIISIHSTTARPKAQCNICGAWLKHESGLRRHLKTQHQDFDVVNCPICKRKVKNKSVLAQHLRTAHVERRHKCLWCDKAFKRAKNLKEHTALHTGEDLYNCPYCEKKFKSNANMYSHRKKAHLAEWTRDFPQLSTLKKKSSTNEEIQAT